jgi:predicted RNase H-like HicB family nuclease
VAYDVVIEYDPETRSYTATVPGLPIVVDAASEEEALRLAREGIAWHLEETSPPKHRVRVKVVSVDV